ncbi:MAG: hypothetical protein A2Z99_14090 [Treponema sp. GWB1_62_6]|nr:MAG: hypothetical protein A2001_17475 [Treponema sp. GWC1_61_84]OHE71399.1 MAG: hypothetical protein A2Z99_14090 [Treponema sp. GWB1_62_6]HCM26786.1 hypothetical protein [Treponema sp.]
MGLMERMTGRGTSADGSSVKLPHRGGLLSAASSLNIGSTSAGSPMELACRDRILRLGSGANSAETALSVIKAYYPFDSGMCCALKADAWISYASLGVQTEEERSVSIPGTRLIADRGVVDLGAAEDLGIGTLHGASRIWAFPFSAVPHGAAECVLLLAEAADSPLPVDEIARVIAACAAFFAPNAPRGGHGDDGLKSALASAFDARRAEGALRMLIVERSAGITAKDVTGASDFLARSRAAVSAVGSCERLSDVRLVIAVPASIDKDLLAHRIVKNLSSAMPGTTFSLVADALASNVEEASAFASRNR